MTLFDDFGVQEIDLMLIDDSIDILELSETVLSRERDHFNVTSTTDPQKALEKLEEGHLDAMISDYDMPQMTGIELLQEVREVDQDLPFILYTGKGTEEVAVDAIKAGVTDYFQKEAGTEHYSLIANSIENSVESYRDNERSQLLRKIVDKSDHPIIVTNTDSEIVYVNPAHEEITGYSLEEVIGENPNMFSSGEHPPELFEEMYQALNSGEEFEINNMRNENRQGDIYKMDQQIIPVSIHGNNPDYFAAIADLD